MTKRSILTELLQCLIYANYFHVELSCEELFSSNLILHLIQLATAKKRHQDKSEMFVLKENKMTNRYLILIVSLAFAIVTPTLIT